MAKTKYKVLNNLPQMQPKDISCLMESLKMYYIKSIADGRDEMILKIMPGDDVVLTIGVGLLPLALSKDNNIADRIKRIRSEIEFDYGIRLRPIRIMDDILLDTYEYCIKIRGEELGRYKINADKFIAIEGGKVKNKINGEMVKEPVFDIPVTLINMDQIASADSGYTIADASTIILTHTRNIIETNLDKLLSYQNSKEILSHVEEEYPELVKDVLQKIEFINLKFILMKLLARKISLSNIGRILELLLLHSKEKNDIEKITELIAKEL
jgi:flagellar biosynthesis protein FlhA